MTDIDQIARRESLYVGGRWVPTSGGESIEVRNPATEEIIGSIPAAGPADVDAAVAAAAGAFSSWSATSREHRRALLGRLHQELAARKDLIATAIATDVGTPMRIAKRIQAQLPLTVLESYLELLSVREPDERIGNSLIVEEPVGVVGAITPWNYPLHQIVCKLAPALAAGATVVCKPSEVAPLAAYLLFDAIDAAGFPPGVANLVPGYGPVAGEALAAHPDVDMISFTGSLRAGARVGELAAATVKKVTLELGGKSANVILDDADLATAVKVGVANCFLNTGQTCTAWTRMLVHERSYDQAVELAGKAAARQTIGDPLDENTRIGPVVSAAQRERVRGYIDTGIREGARAVTGGSEHPPGIERGYYVAPTVLCDVDPDATVAQEEIFGPVLAIIPYRDDTHALEIANNSRYGLAGAVWSADTRRAEEFARKMRTGSVDINGGAYNPLTPFGGYKQSGIGREMGVYGYREYLQVKSLQL